MSTREIIRIISAFIFMSGFLCMPNPGGSPKRWGSNFLMLSDTGHFLHTGIVLLVIGVVLFGVTFIGKRNE
jgi:hypothetical protein